MAVINYTASYDVITVCLHFVQAKDKVSGFEPNS